MDRLCIINNSYTQSLLDSIDDRVVIFHLKKIGKNYKLGYLKQLIHGLAEVVNDKRLGCLFEVGNAEALAQAIDSVVSNISDFNPNWIRENAYNRFSIQVMTSALLNVYKG